MVDSPPIRLAGLIVVRVRLELLCEDAKQTRNFLFSRSERATLALRKPGQSIYPMLVLNQVVYWKWAQVGL
jgi:hypothetical protein